MAIQSINPYTEKIEKTYKALSRVQIKNKIKKAENAYVVWSKTPIKKRVQLIKKLAELLEKNKHEYAKTITKEVGKPLKQAVSEIEKSAKNALYIAEHGPHFLSDEHQKTEAKESFIRYEPLGIVLAVMPWNFPFWQVFRATTLALLAGNACLLKHASNVPESSMLIEKIIRDAGFPKDILQSLLMDSKDIEIIIQNDHVQMVILTGSEAAGSQVGALSGKHITKSVLELGGSDPLIILKDANLKEAIVSGVKARLNNAGQVCNSPKRFIVEAPIYEKAKKLILEELEKVKIGNPLDEHTTLGPLARKDLRDELVDQIKRSVKKGAKLTYGGKALSGKGYFFEPTLLENVKKGNPAFEEELFGPVITLIKAKNEKEAVLLANDHNYGLGGAVWTKNIKKGRQIAEQLVVGMAVVNQTVTSDPRFPFGGAKRSGYGREMGAHGIREFTNIKTIIIK